MTVNVNEIEAIWVAMTFAGFLLAIFALGDAFRSLRAARADVTVSHEVRELTAVGNVRREIMRMTVQGLLLSIAVPGLFSDRPVTLSPVLIALMLIPAILLSSTLFDTWDRSRLADLLVGMVKAERDELALEASVQEVKALTQIAAEKAEAAYDVANHSNEKLATLTELVAGKEDKA